MLRSVDWQLITEVSGRSIDPIFKDQAVQDGTDALPLNVANQIPVFLDCLNLEDGTDRLSRNVGNDQSALRNISGD
jgi:hypothetical protein